MELKKMIEGLALVWPSINKETQEDLAIKFTNEINNGIDDAIKRLKKTKISVDKLTSLVFDAMVFEKQ